MRDVRRSLAIAAGGAVVASAGDLLLLWVAAATRPDLALPSPPAGALGAGSVPGVLAIPLYGVGYGTLARPIAAARPAAAAVIRGSGIAGAAVGALIHGITGLALAAERAVAAGPIEPLQVIAHGGRLLFPLWGVATALVVMASGVWARAAWRGQAAVPPWTAWANPIVGTLVVAAVGATTPLAQALLLPTAPNLAHAIFFAVAAAIVGCSRQP